VDSGGGKLARDFFLVKFVITSKLTDEIFVGYFFGKKDGKFEYNLAAISRRYFSPKMVDLEKTYLGFKRDLEKIKKEIVEKFPNIKELNRDIQNFVRIQIGKIGYDTFAKKLHKTIEDDDEGLLRMLVREIFESWTSRLELNLAYELLDYEIITREMVSTSSDDRIISQIYQRDDLKELPEIYPLIDPVEGVSIDEFQIGDRVFFTVLNPGTEEVKNKLIENFPRHFSKDGDNIMPFVGELLSKEVIPTISKDYVLIKVDFGNEIVGKAIVLRSIKLLATEERLKKPEETEISQNVEEIVSGVPTEPITSERFVRVSKEKQPLFTIDFLYGLLLALLFVALILLITYYFF